MRRTPQSFSMSAVPPASLDVPIVLTRSSNFASDAHVQYDPSQTVGTTVGLAYAHDFPQYYVFGHGVHGFIRSADSRHAHVYRGDRR
jgi:hypothetical protein